MEEMESMSNFQRRTTNGSEHAFPHMAINGAMIKLEGGLSKREYFAAMAMQGMHASTPGCVGESVACFAVKEADTLLKELEKNRGSNGYQGF